MSRADEIQMEEGWRESRSLVMSEMQRLSRAVEQLNNNVTGDLTNMKVEMATLRTRMGMYAAIIAAVAAALMSALINFFMRR